MNALRVGDRALCAGMGHVEVVAVLQDCYVVHSRTRDCLFTVAPDRLGEAQAPEAECNFGGEVGHIKFNGPGIKRGRWPRRRS